MCVCMFLRTYVCMYVDMYVCVCIFFYKNNLLPACSITLICNTTCLFYHLQFCCSVTLIPLHCNCSFHNLSKSTEFVNWVKHFKYLFISSLFSFGQVSCFAMFLIRTSLSPCSFGHSDTRCSTVWLPIPHGHSEESVILNLLR
jgi:hypothetical protein